MAENKSRPIEVAWAAVAWTQFLIAITVIDKQDMKLIATFFHMITPPTPSAFVFDSRPFGSISLLLNVISLALFSLPLSALHTWKDLDFDTPRYMHRARYLAALAHVIWAFSFFALLVYLNAALALIAVISVLSGVLFVGPVSRYMKKT